MLSNCRN